MTSKRTAITVLSAMALAAAVIPFDNGPARAGNGAAFIGGMLAGHVVGGFARRDKARTQADMYRTYHPATTTTTQAAPATQTQAAAPAQPAHKSVEQRLQELDDLAKKGYVTPEEYKARRKAIIDGI